MKMPVFPEDLSSRFFPLLADDAAVQGGFAEIGGSQAMLVYGNGVLARRDFLKALRYFELASSAELPIVNCIDWSGATGFAGLAAVMEKFDCKVLLITLEDCPCILASATVPAKPDKVADALNAMKGENMAALRAAARERLRGFNVNVSAPLEVEICRPEMSDVKAIVRSFEPFVLKRLILPRTEKDIADNLPDFIVAKSHGRIVGTVALRNFDNGLEEVRSLTVATDCEGRGLGSRLVSAVLDLARERDARRVFTLTMRPNLFLRLGFFVVSLMRFPSKVQNDCLACPKKEQCDEVALLLEMH